MHATVHATIIPFLYIFCLTYREQNNYEPAQQNNYEIIDVDQITEEPALELALESALQEPAVNTYESMQLPSTSQPHDNTDFDFLYASLLLDEIGDVELLVEERNDVDIEEQQNLITNQDQVILNVTDIVEELAEANIDTTHISKFNICRSNIWDGEEIIFSQAESVGEIHR